jgi:predicted transglutaminase-like cysteine proteinase
MTIPVAVNDLAYWDTDCHEFVVERGKVFIHAGASSADLRLQTQVEVR